jgi:tetratricopeptide (TPR) repeat protein
LNARIVVVRGILLGLTAMVARPLVGRAFEHVAVGEVVDDAELRTLDGGRHPLAAKGAKANVVVFFRPQQEHSLDTLKDMAACEKDLAGKPVHWVAVVSSAWTPEEVRAVVSETGIRMPVLVDEGDALYGRLGVRLHPTIGILDARRRLVAYEPFRQINYCDRVRARIRLALGELTVADVAKVDAPERSITRTDDGVARRHLNYARTLVRIQKYDRALEEVEKSLEISPSAAAYALQGEILAARGRCPEALRAFDVASKMEPANSVAIEGRKRCGR